MQSEVDKALIQFADEVLFASKRELGTRSIGKNKNYGVASRTLQKNLAYKFTYGKRGISRIQYYAKPPADKYAAFLHFGVNGIWRNRKAPYSFKDDKRLPVGAVREWMKVKPVRLRDPETGQFIKQTEARLNSAAFLIARSIKRQGIEGLFYFEKGYNWAVKKKSKQLEEATARAVKKELSARLSNVTIRLK